MDKDFQAINKVVYMWRQEQPKTFFSGGIKMFVD
jgi:hypothetical protein